MDDTHPRLGTALADSSEGWPDYEPVTDPVRLRHFFGLPLPSSAVLGPRQLSLDMGASGGRELYVPKRPPGIVSADIYNLLFLVYPEPEDAARIDEEGRRLVRVHGLRDRVQQRGRLHTTLCSLGLFGNVPMDCIAAAKAAANSITCPALALRFDDARSYQSGGAFALYGDAATNAAVARLRRPLVMTLLRFGLDPTESHTPHISLVYNCGAVVQAIDVVPQAWVARRFALVRSHVGSTYHELLAEWQLSSSH